jgi:hypothetical protein
MEHGLLGRRHEHMIQHAPDGVQLSIRPSKSRSHARYLPMGHCRNGIIKPVESQPVNVGIVFIPRIPAEVKIPLPPAVG